VRKLLPTLLEGAFAALGAVGVGLIYLPAGLIVFAVMGVLALERADRVKK
jgi:hypothetical protein